MRWLLISLINTDKRVQLYVGLYISFEMLISFSYWQINRCVLRFQAVGI